MSVSVEDRFLTALERPGQWQTVRIADAFNTSDLESIRQLLAKARAILDAFEGILDAVGAFTSILRALESFINDVLLAALVAIIDAIQAAVDEFKSTGVYALDLITPFIGDPNRLGDYCDEQTLSKLSIAQPQLRALEQWGIGARRVWKCQTYEQFIETICAAFLDENDLPSPYISQKILKTFRTEDSKYIKPPIDDTKSASDYALESSKLQNIFRPGRPNFGPNGNLKFYLLVISAFDFAQFINILESFSKFFGDILGNHQAVKELILRSKAYLYCLTKSFTKQAVAGFDDQQTLMQNEVLDLRSRILGYDQINTLTKDAIALSSQEPPDLFINMYNSALSTIDSIDKGDLTKNYTLALADLSTAMLKKKNQDVNVLNSTLGALAAIQSARANVQTAIDEIKIVADDVKAAENKLIRNESERSKVLSDLNKLPTPDKSNPYIRTICGNSDNFINDNEVEPPRARFLATRDPRSIDFYGLSAYQLFPGLFDLIEELLQKVKSYAKPIATGISDLIDNIIRAIREEINNLRQIIDTIERIIQYIEDFLNLNGISLLALDTNNGTYGLVSQLRQAEGFQGKGTGKEMFFAGIMVGVGYPSVDSDTGVFGNVGMVFEAQKDNIKGRAADLETLNNKAVSNSTAAFNKFSQFFK